MDTAFLCIDCGAAHFEPADATLGHRVRCLDCQIEIDLSFELANLPRPQIAA
jgi:DNA-directed RNA polymerase subunit RPC12/RpoP